MCHVFCDLLLNRRTATWNFIVLYNNEIFQANAVTGLCPAFAHFHWAVTKKIIGRNLLSIQNEVIPLAAIHSKELQLVQENHATVKPGSSSSSVSPGEVKTYSESRIELRNLHILKKMLEKSSQFLSSQELTAAL